MKHFLQKILTCMFVCMTCAFGAIDSANAVNFTVTTNSMCKDDKFYFTISAGGNYTVSCQKGTLRSSNCSVSGSNINRSGNTTNCLYYCEFSKYSTSSNCHARTIDFTVNTTPGTYNTSAAAISFYAYGDISNTNDSQLSSNAAHITGISGSLAQMFPYNGSSTNQHPMFRQTFRGASNLTSVSASIFNGYSGNLQGANSMFELTFFGCTNLTSIDYNLFSNITGGGSSMFAQTFYGCSKLNPSTPLRFQITSGQPQMFSQTFMGCTSLVNPPSFSNLSTGAYSMFNQTFSGCSNLTSAPSSFFSSSNVSGQSGMFYGTFENCTKLKTLPSNLFSNITTAANNMFERTFYGCSGFNSNTYVPKTLFAGLTPRQSSYPTNMMQNIFGGSNNLVTSCPSGMSQYGTGYESYWNSKVSCTTGYGVNYSCGSNGTGTPTDSNSPYIEGTTVTALTSSACTAPNGYTFNGWYCDNGVGGVSPGGTFTMPAASVSCTAQWTAIDYTVSFVAGTNGSGSTYYQTNKHVGDTITLPANEFTPSSGYMFYKWNCNNGIGDKAVNETFTMPAANVTCTAQYTTIDYTVSFAQGTYGSGSMSSQTKYFGDTVTLPANGFTAANGYQFTGWNCNNNIGDKAVNETFSMPAASVSCTAQWTAIDYTVSFAQGTHGSGSMSSQTKYFGDTVTLPANGFTAANGYQFTGWNCNNGIGDKAVNETFSMPAASVSCTAQWTPVYTVTYSCGSHGTGTPTDSNSPYIGGATVTALTTSVCTATNGYIFMNWSCDNGVGTKAAGGTFTMPAADVTCTAQWTESKFSVTTTNLSAGDTFTFTLAAIGTFYVDCGDGGVLSGTGVSNKIINRSSTTSSTYTCTYASTGGVKTIRFAGSATRYSLETDNTATISFETESKTSVASVSGGFSSMFPYRSYVDGYAPKFKGTFAGCTNLDNIPATLFNGYTAAGPSAFSRTFAGCTGLTSIPSGLFGNITTINSSAFNSTFRECTGLQTIPSDLFSPNLRQSAQALFAHMFYGCTGLVSLPENLFAGITTTGKYAFWNTFSGCTGLTGYIPPSMFAGLISNNHPYTTNMMQGIFYDTGNLATSCPNGTVQYITGYESYWDGHVSCVPGFNVTYDCGDGSGTPPTGTGVPSNSSFTPASNTCTAPVGYSDFIGWKVSGTNDVKSAGTAFTWNYEGDRKLTAQWTGNTVNLTWYEEDGETTLSGGMPSCTYGGTITPLPTAPAKPGYHFTKWKIIK